MSLPRPPRMDSLLASPLGRDLETRWGRAALKAALSEALGASKAAWVAGGPPPKPESLFEEVTRSLAARFPPPLRRVINATGVVLHTNLGRAPLPKAILLEAAEVLSGFVDIELDLATGERGQRDARLTAAFQELTGTRHEAVLVNNNAAAVLLLLKALSSARETVVSRGELVEIGGGFRVPEVMEASGALLREVGTTNRTRPEDYSKAIGPTTALLLKIHPSNFRVVGFTREVSLSELVETGRRAGIPTAYDLGSGLLLPEGVLPTGEAGVFEALSSGVDALCFSADKLLGGCQAGVLLLRPDLAEVVRREPFLRALRADKYTYFLLGAALDLYRRGKWDEIPGPAMLALSREELLARAKALARSLRRAAPALTVEVVEAEGRVGGGAAPLHALPSPALALSIQGGGASRLESWLRMGTPPVVGVLSENRLLLHLRTILPGEAQSLVRRFRGWAEYFANL